MADAHKYERCEKYYDAFMCLYMLFLGSSDLRDEDKYMLSKCMTFIFLMKFLCDLLGRRLEFLADLTCHSIAIAQMAVHRIYFNCTVFPCDVLCFSFVKIAICRSLCEKLYHVLFSFAATVVTMRLSKMGVPWVEISIPFVASVFILVMLHHCDVEDTRSSEKLLASESRWKELLMRRTTNEAIGTGIVELNKLTNRLRVKLFNLKDEISVIRTLEDMYMQDEPQCRFLDALEAEEKTEGIHRVFLKPDKYFEAYNICTENTKERKTFIVTFNNISSEIANKKLTSTIEQYHSHFERLHEFCPEEREASLIPMLIEDARLLMQHKTGSPVAAQFSLNEAIQSVLGLFPDNRIAVSHNESIDLIFGDTKGFRRLLVNLVLLFSRQSFAIACRETYKNILELTCKDIPPHINTESIEFAVVQSLCRLLGPFDTSIVNRQSIHLYLWVDSRQKQLFSQNVLKGLMLSIYDQQENFMLDPLNTNTKTMIDKRNRLLNTKILIEADKPFTEHIATILKGQHFRHVDLVTSEQTKPADLLILSSASLDPFLKIHSGKKLKCLIVDDSLSVNQIKKLETPSLTSDAIVYPFNQNTLVHKLNHLILSNV